MSGYVWRPKDHRENKKCSSRDHLEIRLSGWAIINLLCVFMCPDNYRAAAPPPAPPRDRCGMAGCSAGGAPCSHHLYSSLAQTQPLHLAPILRMSRSRVLWGGAARLRRKCRCHPSINLSYLNYFIVNVFNLFINSWLIGHICGKVWCCESFPILGVDWRHNASKS